MKPGLKKPTPVLEDELACVVFEDDVVELLDWAVVEEEDWLTDEDVLTEETALDDVTLVEEPVEATRLWMAANIGVRC